MKEISADEENLRLITGPPQLWWTLRIGEFDLDHAKIQTHRTIQDQKTSSTDCRDLQHRVNVQAARCVTAPRSGENCMYARLFTKPVSTDVTQHELIQRASRESREAKSPPGKMSAGRGFFSVPLGASPHCASQRGR